MEGSLPITEGVTLKVALMSDSHDNLPNIRKALFAFNEMGAEFLLHAGDVIAPFAAKEVMKWFGPFAVVYGNNDGERRGLAQVIDGICEPPRRIELDGKTVILAHAIEQAEQSVVASADAVVVGHTHEPSVESGDSLVINPGETGGWLTGRATVAVWDTQSGNVEIVDL
jgi:putative phosphoesterase